MKNYERNGILVDQCTGCGGLFLDKGELEQLAAAENAWHASSAAASPPAAQPRGYDDRHSGYDDRRGSDHKPRKKKSSFLSDLFEG